MNTVHDLKRTYGFLTVYISGTALAIAFWYWAF